MSQRNWILIGLLSALPSLCAVNLARAADSDPAPKKWDRPAGDKATDANPATKKWDKPAATDNKTAPKPPAGAADVGGLHPPVPFATPFKTPPGAAFGGPVPPGGLPAPYGLPWQPGPAAFGTLKLAPPGSGFGGQMMPGLPPPFGLPWQSAPAQNMFFYHSQADGRPGSPNAPIGQEWTKLIISPAFGLPGTDGKTIVTARGGIRVWQNDPEMDRLLGVSSKLEHEAQKLAEEYHHAPKDKLEGVKKKLEDVVAQQFESRQERRSLELKRLEDELTRLQDEVQRIRGSIAKRNEAKKQIIDRRVSEVLGEDDTSF